MNEALHDLYTEAQPIMAEANTLFDTWERYLDGFGHRQDYWDKVFKQACQFIDSHPDYRDYCRRLMRGRIEALEAEQEMIKKRPTNLILEEVFKKHGQI